MSYFNYHGKIKHLILNGHLLEVQFFAQWNKIKNAFVFFFDNNKPMPVRDYAIENYAENDAVQKCLVATHNFIKF